ncbi:exosome complex component RRP4 isoform X3 [Pogoniulus pusillus]|uniref:exosome complex component RRP4 isoform X3 n=1 Tax=Pogoniulus pusillus TaxID=488313 RepID=UPI0030B96D5F
MAAVSMRLPVARKAAGPSAPRGGEKHLVAPGDTITTDTGYMRGHGTYVEEEKLIASVAGAVERVNKLVCVKALKTRYNGEVGDIVVGRITEVQQKRWKVETNSRLDSVLLLSSMNLPGGELRRRSAEDELAMRDYLQEGDLISAEVQSVFSDGAVSLHTRSLKYGKLGQGVLVQVSPSLVKRQKTHFHDLPCGASVILGNNGFIWIYPTPEQKDEEAGGFTTNLEPVPLSDREVISRLRNCVVALVTEKLMLFDTSILYCYEASLPHQPTGQPQPAGVTQPGHQTSSRAGDRKYNTLQEARGQPQGGDLHNLPGQPVPVPPHPAPDRGSGVPCSSRASRGAV